MSLDKYTEILKEYFGIDNFRGNQYDVVRALIEDKKDVCAIMCTGAGKSLCYQFPAVYMRKLVLVISPLIALMNDQIKKLENSKVRVNCLNGSVGFKERKLILDDIFMDNYDIIYITPEYILTHPTFIPDLVEVDTLGLIAIDEAHCVSCWGNDFRKSYRDLQCLKSIAPNIPIIALTATATKTVEHDIIKTLKLSDPVIIRSSFDRPNIYIEIKLKQKDYIVNEIYELVRNDESSIVYCRTKDNTEKIAKLLSECGLKCTAYHADMSSIDRNDVHNKFIIGEINCIVATIAFGMGIDKTIRTVIHYDIPKDIESYYQEIGRAGRDGNPSKSYIFYSSSDIISNTIFINKTINEKYKNNKIEMLVEIIKYIYSGTCRRKFILKYFDEIYPHDNCKNCDICTNNEKIINDYTLETNLILTCVNDIWCKYGFTTHIDVLLGKNNKKINKLKIKRAFGKGIHRTDKWWKIFILIMISNEYIYPVPMKSGLNGFGLKITQKGKKFGNNKANYIIPYDLLNINNNIKKNNCNNVFEIKKIPKDISTCNITIDMLKKGMSISEISKERNIKEITIEKHIETLYTKELNIDNLIGYSDKKYNTISKELLKIGDYKNIRLRNIKNKIPNVSYLDICITIKLMDKK
jgi:RecQ family ATP-dependent DNA helicase